MTRVMTRPNSARTLDRLRAWILALLVLAAIVLTALGWSGVSLTQLVGALMKQAGIR